MRKINLLLGSILFLLSSQEINSALPRCDQDIFTGPFCMPREYDRDKIPNNDNKALNITVDIWVFEVSKIDDLALSITFELYFDLKWMDNRLVINHSSPEWGPNGQYMGSTNYATDLWLPDIQIMNLKKFQTRRVTTDVAGLIVFNTTEVLYTVSTEAVISCPMKFSAYPLDHQTCKFTVGSYIHDSSQIWFNGSFGHDIDNQRAQQHEIEITNFETNDTFYHWANRHYSLTGFKINLNRRRTPVLLQTYLPSGLFVVVSWISFIVPPEVVPGRMALLVTLFLVLVNIFNSVTEHAPKSEGLTAVETWVVMCILHVFCVLAEYAIILKLIQGEKQKMVNLRKAAIRLQKANTQKEVNNKRLQISPSNDSSHDYRQNCTDPNLDSSETSCFYNSLCFGQRLRKRRRLQFAGATRDRDNGTGRNNASYGGRSLVAREFSSTNQNSNDTENHIKLQPCQNMMLHSSEPSLLQRNTTRDISSAGRAITNSNTRDASTSTVPKAKHIISQTTSVQLMANDNQSLGVVEVSQSHNESYKPSAPEESRFQNSSYEFLNYRGHKNAVARTFGHSGQNPNKLGSMNHQKPHPNRPNKHSKFLQQEERENEKDTSSNAHQINSGNSTNATNSPENRKTWSRMDMYINPSDRNPIEVPNTELVRNTNPCLSAQGQNIDSHFTSKDKIDSKAPESFYSPSVGENCSDLIPVAGYNSGFSANNDESRNKSKTLIKQKSSTGSSTVGSPFTGQFFQTGDSDGINLGGQQDSINIGGGVGGGGPMQFNRVNTRRYERIDRIAMKLFPLIFILVNILYWSYYLLLHETFQELWDNGFGGCEETMVTNNCDQYAYSDACSDA